MKKFFIIVLVFLLVICTTSCSDYSKLENRSATCQYPGGFFPEDEQRYILIDESTQNLGGYSTHCYIYADIYTHIMYGYYVTSSGDARTVTMIQLEHADGTPMLYDAMEQ